METDELVCERDGAPTRLRCANCETGICPRCLVRTPVGHKCDSCAGRIAIATRSRTSPILLTLAGAVVVIVALVVLNGRHPAPRAVPDPVAVRATGAGSAPTGEAMIGEPAHDGQFSFVVDEFSCGTKQMQVGALTREAQGTFCLLHLTVTNDSNSPALFLSGFQHLLDGPRTYGPDDRLTASQPENGNRSLTDLNVNPDISVTVVLVFDVPDGLNLAEARLTGNGRSRLGVNVRLQRRAG